jgi:hypothetical protein
MHLSGDFLFRLVLGHLVGDYLLQSLRQALNKKKSVWICLEHCLTYTLSVCFFTMQFWWELSRYKITIIIVGVFLSHFVLDYTDLVNKWLHHMKSRSYERTEEYVKSLSEDTRDALTDYARAYTALVQAIADNTLHLFFMYFLFRAI